MVLLFLFQAASLWGQVSGPGAPVQVNGQSVFVLRTGVGSFSPAERAQAVNQRLAEVLKSPPADFKARVKESDGGLLILVGDQPIVSVTDRDAQVEKVSTRALADKWAGAIEAALQNASREKSRGTFWRRLLITVAVVLAAFLALLALQRGQKKLAGFLESRRQRIPRVRFRGLELTSSETIFQVLKRALSLLYGASLLLVFASALLLVFGQFPSTRGYAGQVWLWIWNPLVHIWRGILDYLPNLFYILVILVVARAITRALSFIAEQTERGVISLEPWIHQDVVRPTRQILKGIIIVITLFFIAPLIPGTGSTAAQGVSVIIGLMVSFGSTSTIGNLIAGVVLTYMRPFQLGDRVKLGDTVGDVVEKAFLYTKVLTIKNEEVMVPSLQALSGVLTNYSARARQGGLILHTTVTIGYDAPWRKVHELLLQAADKTTHLLKEPRPFVLQTSLDDWYVSYQINAHTDQPNKTAVIYAELHQNIQDSFNEGGVEIMSPHYFQLRDGNATTIPTDYLKNYEPPRFLVDARTRESKGPGGNVAPSA
jgi:small-conductance mechanosensitive channel